MSTRFLALTFFAVLFLSCSSNPSNTAGPDSTGVMENEDTDTAKNDTAYSLPSNDTSISVLGDTILTLIKNQEYSQLATFIHPKSGIRFSPYGQVDTGKNQHLSRKEYLELINNKKTVNWGTAQGSGDPIMLGINEYFKKFVYDVDFEKPEKISVNKIIGADSSSSNVTSVYPNCNFVQYYFSGINKKYEGMDWKSLTLVFRKEGDKSFLVGLVHDQWKG